MTYTAGALYTRDAVSAYHLTFYATSSENNLTALHGMSLAVGEYVYDIDSPDNTISAKEYKWDTSFDFTDGDSYTVRIAPTIKASWGGSPEFTGPTGFYDTVSFPNPPPNGRKMILGSLC